MTRKTPEDLVGWNFDWLATDADGHVGCFSSGGDGWIPPEVLEDTEAHDAALEWIDASPPLIEPKRSKRSPAFGPVAINVWTPFADRGVFVYESDSDNEPRRVPASRRCEETDPPGGPARDRPERRGTRALRVLFCGRGVAGPSAQPLLEEITGVAPPDAPESRHRR